MKITDRNLFACEQERERRSVLASQATVESKQEESDKEADDAAFWKAFRIFANIVAVLIILTTLYRMWGK